MGTTTPQDDQFHALLKEYSYPLSLEGENTASRTLRLVGKNKRVLELGCSVGTQSKVLRHDLNCDVTGIEINPSAAEQARRYCSRVIVGNLDELDFRPLFPQEKFDVVLCADVLEHLYNPTSLLSRVKPLIDTNGYLIASIPNIVHIAILLEMLHGKFDYKNNGILDNSHIRFFTRKTIITSFTEAEFTIALLERSYARENETEFDLRNTINNASRIIEYIRTNNEECFTYHFIVKATPSQSSREELSILNAHMENSSLIALATDKERELAKLERRINELQSNLTWLENKTPVRIARWIMSLIHNKSRNLTSTKAT
ncbi:class I SAM-dependent methyltransferase [Aromatoleum evansii]|uniref:Class I SAM-dependent methyltransferase n=1 Tax=Aromatoleum evansii TaxID=59406 RepID=A0ABZ1AI66_AROEV|nr:class I SAM-dependent methyltransferase [Aromatoleum evansii]